MLYAKDAVLVTDKGPISGREAIEKHFSDLFQKVQFSNNHVTVDQYWTVIREGDDWKIQVDTWNVTPSPAKYGDWTG